jgi:hypothetical protein
MEKRSRRRIRDLVTQSASQGLSQNEIGCARISMMAKSTNALFTGRIQKRKTNTLHRSHLTCNTRPVGHKRHDAVKFRCPLYPRKRTFLAAITMSALGHKRTHAPQQFVGVTLDPVIGTIRLHIAAACPYGAEMPTPLTSAPSAEAVRPRPASAIMPKSIPQGGLS